MSKPVIFFEAIDSTGREGLWESDGTSAETFEIGGLGSAGIAGADDEFVPTDIAAFANGVLFEALDSSGGLGLWFSDGTAAGTVEIGSANDAGVAGAPVNGLGEGRLDPQDITPFGTRAAFLGLDAASGAHAIWITDGTAAGTTELGGAGNAGIGIAAGSASDLVAFGDEVFFTATDSSGNAGLWITDGTVAGTQEIVGKNDTGLAGVSKRGVPILTGPMDLGSLAVFVAGTSTGGRLCVSNGSSAGTLELGGPNNAVIACPANPSDLTRLGSRALFVAGDLAGGEGLWVTDGTVAGTGEIGGFFDQQVAKAGSAGLNPADIVSLGNGKAVFVGQDASGATSLWVTDGTAAGTAEVGGLGGGDLPYVNAGALDPQQLTSIGGKAIFLGEDADGHKTLWVTDGTTAGTSEIGGVNNSGVSGEAAHGLSFSNAVSAGSLAYFLAANASGQMQLWVTDGTAAGTQVVAGANAGSSTAAPAVPGDAADITAASVVTASYSAAAIDAFTSAQISDFATLGVTRIAAGGSVALPLAQALAFAAAGMTFALPAGASATISGLPATSTLTAAQVTALQRAGFVGVSPTAAQFDAITGSQMSALKAAGLTKFAVGGSVSLNAANALTFANDGLTLALPASATATLFDSAAALQALTSAQIAALAKAGFDVLDAQAHNLVFNGVQTAALQAANFRLEAANGATATESEINGGYKIYSGPAGTLTSSKMVMSDGSYETYALVSGHAYTATESFYDIVAGHATFAATAYENKNGSGSLTLAATSAGVATTLTDCAGALGVATSGGAGCALPFHNVETVTLATGPKSVGHDLSFAKGFGSETVVGFTLSGAHADTLTFDPALFTSASNPTTSQAMSALDADLSVKGANLVITDLYGDSLTLDGVSKASFVKSAHVLF